jgi:hypothetical protein
MIEQIGPVNDVVMNGDAIDGPGRKDTTGHLTTDIEEQQEMAETILDYVKAERRHVVRGTGFHTDGDKAYENDLESSYTGDDLRLMVHGRRVHFRHVVGRSDTPYGQYTQIAKELTNEIMQASFEGYEPADVIIRSHVHYHAMISVGDATTGYSRIAFSTPSLELRGPRSGPFVRKLRTWLYHVGVTLIEIDETGEVFVRPFLFPIDRYMRREYQCLTA